MRLPDHLNFRDELGRQIRYALYRSAGTAWPSPELRASLLACAPRGLSRPERTQKKKTIGWGGGGYPIPIPIAIRLLQASWTPYRLHVG